jgi:hypothetical protein
MGYENVGMVELIVDTFSGDFKCMEMNTQLQGHSKFLLNKFRKNFYHHAIVQFGYLLDLQLWSF